MNRRELIRLSLVIMTFASLLAVQMVPGLAATNLLRQESGSEVINLNLQDVSLKNTLQLLCNRLGRNLLLDAGVEEQFLNMNLSNITPSEAFKAILEANELSYKELDGNVFYVAYLDKIGSRAVVRQIRCKYASSEELVKILATMVGSETGAVMSDNRTNTVIIKESPDVISRMEVLISELDKPTRQVYIQAEIIEVSSTDDKQLGVEWLWKTANYKSFSGQTGTNFGLQGFTESGSTPEEDAKVFPVGSGLGIGVLNADVDVVLHALGEVNNVNLLSRPRIITMDNQESTIEVGDQIPFKRLNQFGVTSFEFKDATVQLLVKPHVIDSNYILLDVSPKADFQNGFTPDGTPIISTRKASTNVKVRNGRTIVIGGLIRDSEVLNVKKVPFLGDIPLLGALFRSKIASKRKTELIVFITPIILNDNVPAEVFEEDFKTRKNLKKKFE